jgi:uncharacterized phage protein (TIGR01671 family)
MNRELKFRIWDKKNNMFIYVWDASHKRLAISLNGLVYSGMYDDVLPENDYTIQQYTGLKDRNGKEIYEGDIVTYQQPYRASRLTHPATTDSYRTIKAPVIYNQDNFTYEIDRYALGTPMIKTRKDIEVVGNIFENPELIKNNDHNNQ